VRLSTRSCCLPSAPAWHTCLRLVSRVCSRLAPAARATSGLDISHARCGKIMRELGLVRQTPAERLPPAPAEAAAAMFMGMHERLGAESLVFLLDAPLLADILDCYAQIYAQLPGSDVFGDLSPWSSALGPPLAPVASSSEHSTNKEAEMGEHGAQVRSAPAPSARRRSRVLHLPSFTSASAARARHAGGSVKLERADGSVPTVRMPSTAGVEPAHVLDYAVQQPRRRDSNSVPATGQAGRTRSRTPLQCPDDECALHARLEAVRWQVERVRTQATQAALVSLGSPSALGNKCV